MTRVIEKERDGAVTLLAPALDIDLAEGAVEWAVAKPANLKKTHGIDITAERLAEMVAAYDPENVEMAPLNFDHEPGGPAHGWVASLAIRDGMLWARPVDLSDQLVEGIKSGRYKRASIELTQTHPETGGWYLNGLAVLGNAKPAIKALPPLRLSERCLVVQLENDAPTAQGEEMNKPNAEALATPVHADEERSFWRRMSAVITGKSATNLAAMPAEEGDKGAEECPTCKGSGWVVNEVPAAEAESAPAPEAKASAKPDMSALVAAEVQKLMAEQYVAADLARLAAKVAPAVISGAKPALLRAKAEGRTEDYAAMLSLLSGQDASALLGGPIATETATRQALAPVANLSAADVDALMDDGVTPERLAALAKKYNLNDYFGRLSGRN